MGISQYLALIGFGQVGWGWQFLAGIWLTVQISISGYFVGLVLGLLGAWAKLSGNRITFLAAESYTTIVRAVPELLLIILIYYTGTSALRNLLVGLGFGQDLEVNAFGAAVGTLGFVQGAYTTEVFRGAILSVPKGQMEAAKAFGLSSVLRFRRILFPLMFRYALPGLSNLWLSILKDSSLISVVGFSELLFTGKTAAASTKHHFYFYFVTALAFLVLTSLSNIVIRQIERSTRKGVRLT